MPGIERGNEAAEELGRLWQSVREESGVTQPAVRTRLNISVSTQWRIEHGKNLPIKKDLDRFIELTSPTDEEREGLRALFKQAWEFERARETIAAEEQKKKEAAGAIGAKQDAVGPVESEETNGQERSDVPTATPENSPPPPPNEEAAGAIGAEEVVGQIKTAEMDGQEDSDMPKSTPENSTPPPPNSDDDQGAAPPKTGWGWRGISRNILRGGLVVVVAAAIFWLGARWGGRGSIPASTATPASRELGLVTVAVAPSVTPFVPSPPARTSTADLMRGAATPQGTAPAAGLASSSSNVHAPEPTANPYPTFTPTPADANSSSVPPPAVAEGTSSAGTTGVIIGALYNDGSAATNTWEVHLYPKTLEDAAGQLHGDQSKELGTFPQKQTAMAAFYGLEPGVYVVCFVQAGGSLNVGEISVRPGEVVRKNFRWPPSFRIGTQCRL